MDYHAYRDHADEIGYTPEREGTLQKYELEHIQDHFFSVVEKLYSLGHLDMELLEFSLDEIARVLGQELPRGKMHIARKNNNDIYDFAVLLTDRKYAD